MEKEPGDLDRIQFGVYRRSRFFSSLIETFGRNRKSIDNFRGRGRSYVFVSGGRSLCFCETVRAADQDTKRWCNPIGWKKLSGTTAQAKQRPPNFSSYAPSRTSRSRSGGEGDIERGSPRLTRSRSGPLHSMRPIRGLFPASSQLPHRGVYPYECFNLPPARWPLIACLE